LRPSFSDGASLSSSLTPLNITSDAIHVWYASLSEWPSLIQSLEPTLSVDERLRAEGFHFERDRQQFIVRRGILRKILGHYWNTEPGHLQFSYGENGKPGLAPMAGKQTIHFNVSHSDGVALFAFSRDHEIGVDIERVRGIDDVEQIASRFFSKEENDTFRILSYQKKKEAFFNCWTRKEAYIKATGAGMAYPLDQFEVSLTPGEPARLLGIMEDRQAAERWSIYALHPAAGYKAALAVESRGLKLSCHEWVW